MTKQIKWHVRPAKTQINLGIRPVWSESLLCAQWVAKDARCLHADIEDSDQTGRMLMLIWVFVGRTGHIAVFVMSRLSTVERLFRTGTIVMHLHQVAHKRLICHLIYIHAFTLVCLSDNSKEKQPPRNSLYLFLHFLQIAKAIEENGVSTISKFGIKGLRWV